MLPISIVTTSANCHKIRRHNIPQLITPPSIEIAQPCKMLQNGVPTSFVAFSKADQSKPLSKSYGVKRADTTFRSIDCYTSIFQDLRTMWCAFSRTSMVYHARTKSSCVSSTSMIQIRRCVLKPLHLVLLSKWRLRTLAMVSKHL